MAPLPGKVAPVKLRSTCVDDAGVAVKLLACAVGEADNVLKLPSELNAVPTLLVAKPA